MNVLLVSGDKHFKPGHPRFDLQKAAVERLEAVFWGRGSVWPKIPEGSFDVVSVQDPFWRGLFAFLLARRLGARFNVQVHTDLESQRRLFSLRTRIATFVLRRADSIRVVSEKIKQQVEALSIHGKISVLPIFVDTEAFRAIAPVPHEKKTILWLGRFEPEKDPLAALEVFKTVCASVPEAELVMLGRGSLERQLREAAEGLAASPIGGLRPRVAFPGWQDPKPALARADVVLSTSRHESWGASIIEALAAGVPVVAPDVGVAKEAGAIVAPLGHARSTGEARKELAERVLEVLASGERGTLKLTLPDAREWAVLWRETL